MSSKLEVLKAELEQLEANDGYDAPQYDYLFDTVTALEAEERAAKAKPPAAGAPAPEPERDPLQVLTEEMETALARLEAGHTDVDADGLIARCNALWDAGNAGPEVERVDVRALLRELVVAQATPDTLTQEQADDLARRYDLAVRQSGEPRTLEVLRGELASGDLPTRLLAADALADRGELSAEEVATVIGAYNDEVDAAAERGLNVEELPEALRPAATELLEQARRLDEEEITKGDPARAAVLHFDRALAALRPPSVAEQLGALGLDPDLVPEQEPQPQEA